MSTSTVNIGYIIFPCVSSKFSILYLTLRCTSSLFQKGNIFSYQIVDRCDTMSVSASKACLTSTMFVSQASVTHKIHDIQSSKVDFSV